MDTIFYIAALLIIPWFIGVFIALFGVLTERIRERGYFEFDSWRKP